MKDLTKKMMLAVIPVFMAVAMVAGTVTPINPALDPPKSAAPNPGCYLSKCPEMAQR